MSDENKIYTINLTNLASLIVHVIAPDEDEAERIALENVPYNDAFDDWEFSEEWEINEVKENPNANPSDFIDQEYELD